MWTQLADVGALYPGVGWEIPLVAFVAAVWLGWTVWQFRHENAHYDEQLRLLRDQAGGNSEERP